MSVAQITSRLANMKRIGDQKLRKDVMKFESQPEIKAREREEIAEGKRFSPIEWKKWRGIVRNQIDAITKRSDRKISPGSSEELAVFAAVGKFRKELTEDRQNLLDETHLLARRVMADLTPHRPQK